MDKIAHLEREIRQVQQEIASLGDLRPGTLSRQYNVCGNPTCRCKASPPKKHGPYFQISWTRHSRSRSRFVRTPHLPTIRQELKNYARLQSLLHRWLDASIHLSDIHLKSDPTP